jgi:hypothetical protein
MTEADFLAKAAETAKRPTDREGQQCEAWYYAGMKRLFAGDKKTAIADFRKCLASGACSQQAYLCAQAALKTLGQP